MNEVDAWIYLDGPEPEHVRAFLDALLDLPPAAPEDKARVARAFFEALDAELGYEPEPSHAPPINPHSAAAPAGHLAAAPVVTPPASVPWPSAPVPSASYPPPQPVPAPLPPAPPATHLPPVSRPPAALAVTAPLPPHAALPSPAAAAHISPDASKRPRAALTQNSEVMRDPRHRKTAPLLIGSVPNPAAAAPFAGNAVGTPAVSIPPLDLNQYASLRAVLAVHPERSAEILRNYGVLSEASWRALVAYWEKHFTDHPQQHAAYDTLLARHTYSLRSQQGQPR